MDNVTVTISSRIRRRAIAHLQRLNNVIFCYPSTRLRDIKNASVSYKTDYSNVMLLLCCKSVVRSGFQGMEHVKCRFFSNASKKIFFTGLFALPFLSHRQLRLGTRKRICFCDFLESRLAIIIIKYLTKASNRLEHQCRKAVINDGNP